MERRRSRIFTPGRGAFDALGPRGPDSVSLLDFRDLEASGGLIKQKGYRDLRDPNIDSGAYVGCAEREPRRSFGVSGYRDREATGTQTSHRLVPIRLRGVPLYNIYRGSPPLVPTGRNLDVRKAFEGSLIAD